MRTVGRRTLENVIRAMEACGQPFTAAKVSPDGTVTLLTTDSKAPILQGSNDDDDWVNLAGQTEIHRAPRA